MILWVVRLDTVLSKAIFVVSLLVLYSTVPLARIYISIRTISIQEFNSSRRLRRLLIQGHPVAVNL
jgi:hypothetical protein